MDEARDALVSDCGTYRYWLSRSWGDGPRLVWAMLNPSTADAAKDDPTIRKVRGFTKRLGYPGFVVVNVWALRATDPKDLHARREAFEPENIKLVKDICCGADVIAAWGGRVAEGPALQKVRQILHENAASVRCFGWTKNRAQPRHPLMLAYSTPVEPYWGMKEILL